MQLFQRSRRVSAGFDDSNLVAAAHRAGAKVSVTARMDWAVKRAVASINEKAWTTIQYTDTARDETTGAWISSAEVAETACPQMTLRGESSRGTLSRCPGHRKPPERHRGFRSRVRMQGCRRRRSAAPYRSQGSHGYRRIDLFCLVRARPSTTGRSCR